MKTRFLFYRDRPEWADVTPIPQDEDGRVVVKIAYSPEFVDAHDYLRAMLFKDERSERALELTNTILYLNPANYTVYEYRRQILLTLNSDLVQELKFVEQLIDDCSKNYQLWHHRQWCITQLMQQTDPSHIVDRDSLEVGELSFTGDVIADDPKHYHAWQYRRWVVNYFNVSPLAELAYTHSIIQKDVYNNSAWNHRFITVTKDEGLTPTVLQREVDFVQQMILRAPNNDSAWNYLYGLLVPPPTVVASARQNVMRSNPDCPRPDLSSFTTSTEVINEVDTDHRSSQPIQQLICRPPSVVNIRKMRQFAENLATHKSSEDSAAVWSFLVEVYTDCIQSKLPNGFSCDDHVTLTHNSPAAESTDDESVTQLVDLGVTACERLATELDRVRANYWRYRSRQLQSFAAECPPST